MKSYSYYRFFVNFATKTKLDIIMLLRNGPLSVKEITGKIGGEQSRVSHSLGNLRRCRILEVRHEGKQRIYSLNKETVIPMLKIVEKHVRKKCPKLCGMRCDI